MRLTSDFWVSALLRRVNGEGGFAAVLKRGAAEAGAVFIVTRNRMGEVALLVPASQTSYEAGRPEERFFSRVPIFDQDAVDARLVREQRFDGDIWVVEIEPGPTAIEDLVTLAEA